MTPRDQPAALDAQLRTAIAGTRLIQLRYGGKLRVAEPHDYGVQNGSVKLLIYQLRASGGSPSKGVRGWRLLDVPKIAHCAVLDETFPGSRENRINSILRGTRSTRALRDH